MMRRPPLYLLAIVAIAVALADAAATSAITAPVPNMLPLYRARRYNWNYNYAHAAYGQPVALVVPPTATMQTNWGWGVSSSRISRIDHQFGRNYYGPGPYGGPFRSTPAWPSDTTQFGVYNVRGPW